MGVGRGSAAVDRRRLKNARGANPPVPAITDRERLRRGRAHLRTGEGGNGRPDAAAVASTARFIPCPLPAWRGGGIEEGGGRRRSSKQHGERERRERGTGQGGGARGGRRYMRANLPDSEGCFGKASLSVGTWSQQRQRQGSVASGTPGRLV